MKTLVAYFSRTGHTQQLASEIARICDADLEAIREGSDRSGPWGYLRTTWQALWRAATPILPGAKDPSRYDLVVIGTPIWDFGLASPVRSYARQHAAHFKRVAFFCTEGGSGDARAFAELRRICGQAPVATLALTERQLPEPAHREPLQGFAARLAAG